MNNELGKMLTRTTLFPREVSQRPNATSAGGLLSPQSQVNSGQWRVESGQSFDKVGQSHILSEGKLRLKKLRSLSMLLRNSKSEKIGRLHIFCLSDKTHSTTYTCNVCAEYHSKF